MCVPQIKMVVGDRRLECAVVFRDVNQEDLHRSEWAGEEKG